MKSPFHVKSGWWKNYSIFAYFDSSHDTIETQNDDAILDDEDEDRDTDGDGTPDIGECRQWSMIKTCPAYSGLNLNSPIKIAILAYFDGTKCSAFVKDSLDWGHCKPSLLRRSDFSSSDRKISYYFFRELLGGLGLVTYLLVNSHECFVNS